MPPRPKIEPLSLNESDIWRQIPPEEKFELMASAHASGVVASVISIMICSTIAVGLKLSWIMWGSLLVSPFVFQFAAGKRWRSCKPRVMLEYLAARSAARRFAFSARGKDLQLKMMFRGKIERLYDESHIQEALEAAIENTKEAQVWIALFGDSVVMMEEYIGGATLKFSHVLDDKLEITGASLDGKGDYSARRELTIVGRARGQEDTRIKVTSRYPAALLVFEKMMKSLQENIRIGGASLAAVERELLPGQDDSGTYNF